MPSILTTDFRTQNALNFLNAMDLSLTNSIDTTTDDIITYFYIGKVADTTDGGYVASNEQWNVGDTPISPVFPTDEAITRSEMFALKRIDRSNCSLVIPKVDWVSAIYNVGDTVFVNNIVYQCTVSASPTSSLDTPEGATTDGYTWIVIYNLTAGFLSEFGTATWIPVPYGSTETNTQVEFDAPFKINELATTPVSTVMVNVAIVGSDTAFLDNYIFRRMGLITNPLEIGGTGLRINQAQFDTSSIDTTSGNIIYAEHIAGLEMVTGQIENFKMIITF